MIALLLILQALPAAPAGTQPGPIGRQALPARGCAAYLWSRGPEPQLVAMATADPPALTLALGGGRPVAYPQATTAGEGAGMGFARQADYRAGEATATLEMTLAERPDLSQGAAVTDATLSLRWPGGDTLVVPLGGMVGCGNGR